MSGIDTFASGIDAAWNGFSTGMYMGDKIQGGIARGDARDAESQRLKNEEAYKKEVGEILAKEWWVDPQQEMSIPGAPQAAQPSANPQSPAVPESNPSPAAMQQPLPPGLNPGGQPAPGRTQQPSQPGSATGTGGNGGLSAAAGPTTNNPQDYWLKGEAERYDSLAKTAIKYGKTDDAQLYLRQRDRSKQAYMLAQKDASAGLQFHNGAMELNTYDMLKAGHDPNAVIWAYNNQLPQNYEVVGVQKTGDGWELTRRNGQKDVYNDNSMSALRSYIDQSMPQGKPGGRGLDASGSGLQGLTPGQARDEARALRKDIKESDDWGERYALAKQHDQITGSDEQSKKVGRDLEREVKRLLAASKDESFPKAAAEAKASLEAIHASIQQKFTLPGKEGAPPPAGMVEDGRGGLVPPGATGQPTPMPPQRPQAGRNAATQQQIVPGEQAAAIVKQSGRKDLPPPDQQYDVTGVEIMIEKNGKILTKIIPFDPSYINNQKLKFTGRYIYSKKKPVPEMSGLHFNSKESVFMPQP